MNCKGFPYAIPIPAGAPGCSSKLASLTMLSTRKVEMSQTHDRLDRAKANDGRPRLVFLPLGGSPSGLQAARRIIEESDADCLTNIEVVAAGR
jgi:hypothetical protein